MAGDEESGEEGPVGKRIGRSGASGYGGAITYYYFELHRIMSAC